MKPQADPRRMITRLNISGALLLLVLLAGAGGWAASTEISGAVVSSGFVVVESSVKKVQHLTGGIVGELLVEEGDHVEAGDVLIRLDATQARASLAILTNSLNELLARRARLQAEREGERTIEFPAELTRQRDDPELAAIMRGEQRLLDLRLGAQEAQKSQLQERVAQYRGEIEGLEAQVAAKDEELRLIETDLERLRGLLSRGLTASTPVTEREREAARLKGERGALLAAIAQAKGRIAETELQVISIDQEFRSRVASELRETEARISELSERRIAAEDQARRIDIRAPQSGVVHQLAVHTVGGVVAAGDALMLIVPDDATLEVEARVPPVQIDQLFVGQTAVLRFAAFNPRITPEILGTVARIGADITRDETGTPFYIVRIAIPPDEVASKLGDRRILPGMLVEVFIQTTSRTVMSYLLKPLEEQIARAFRER
jgi:HlyD family secretion protein